MKKLILLIAVITISSTTFAQDKCASPKALLAGFTTSATAYHSGEGGVWTGEYQWIGEEVNGIPPHWELFMGNTFIKSPNGKKNGLIRVYGFHKGKYRNQVKLKEWDGYEVKVEESFGRIWVISYLDKVDNAAHHKMVMDIFEQVSGRCHGNPSY